MLAHLSPEVLLCSLPHTQGFVHHSLVCFGDSFLPKHGWCLCSAVGERSPCARACWAWAPREMHPQGMAFLSLRLCRQESHLRQKPSLRRTRAWCGSCWSSCGLAWTCLGWCCPPSSWSHARSSTNSPTTTTMPTCSPSKQHTGWAWPGTWPVFLKISLCVPERLPNDTEITGLNTDQAPAAVIFTAASEGQGRKSWTPDKPIFAHGHVCTVGWNWWEFSWCFGVLHSRAVPPPGVLVYTGEQDREQPKLLRSSAPQSNIIMTVDEQIRNVF